MCHIFVMSVTCLRHDVMSVTRLIYTSDMTLSYVQLDSSLSIAIKCNALLSSARQFRRRNATPATRYITLQHTATHCNTLQHTAAHHTTVQHTATHYNKVQHSATQCNTVQHTATHCNILQQIATHCNALQRTATNCNEVQLTTAYCNLLQRTLKRTARPCSHPAP